MKRNRIQRCMPHNPILPTRSIPLPKSGREGQGTGRGEDADGMHKTGKHVQPPFPKAGKINGTSGKALRAGSRPDSPGSAKEKLPPNQALGEYFADGQDRGGELQLETCSKEKPADGSFARNKRRNERKAKAQPRSYILDTGKSNIEEEKVGVSEDASAINSSERKMELFGNVLQAIGDDSLGLSTKCEGIASEDQLDPAFIIKTMETLERLWGYTSRLARVSERLHELLGSTGILEPAPSSPENGEDHNFPAHTRSPTNGEIGDKRESL